MSKIYAYLLYGTIFFGAILGLWIAFAGIQRMIKGFCHPMKVESIFWGLAGIIIGIAMVAGVIGIVRP